MIVNVGARLRFGVEPDLDVELVVDGRIELGRSQAAKVSTVQPSSAGFADRDVVAIRFSHDGTTDEDFGEDGAATADISGDGDLAQAVGIDRRGRLVLAGAGSVGEGDQPVTRGQMPPSSSERSTCQTIDESAATAPRGGSGGAAR